MNTVQLISYMGRIRYSQIGQRQKYNRVHTNYMLYNKSTVIHSEYVIFHTVYGTINTRSVLIIMLL